MVSVGAKVLGSFTIGENSKIGAGSVVLNEIPPNCTVVWVPGKIVKRGDAEIPRKTMDQVHLPDPIQDDINTLKHADTEITNQLLSLKDTVRELKREIEKGKTGSNEDI